MTEDAKGIWENYEAKRDELLRERVPGRGSDKTGAFSAAGGYDDNPLTMDYDDLRTPGEVAARVGGDPNPSSGAEDPFTMRSDQAGFSIPGDRTAVYYLNPMLITWWPSGTQPGYEIIVHKGKLIERVGWFTQDEMAEKKGASKDPKEYAKKMIMKRFGVSSTEGDGDE